MLCFMAYDPANHEMFVSNDTNSMLIAIGSTSNKVVAEIPIPTALYFAYDPVNHDIYVAGSTIYVVDGSSNEIVSEFISTSSAEAGTATFNPVAGSMYVSITSVPGDVEVFSS